MYTTATRNRIFVVLFLLSLFGFTIPAQAQNAVRQTRPLIATFKSVPTAEPVFENPPRQIVFKITTSGELTGDLNGTLTQQITQVVPDPEPSLEPITAFFTIETATGKIEGYATGSFYIPKPGDNATVTQHGQVISVTGEYANLYLADVYLDSTVTIENGAGVAAEGSISIVPIVK